MGTGLFEASPFLLLLLLGYCLAVIEGDLRCYCNESGCVSTGYMCKSTVGQCFTSLEVRGDVMHQTHGCVDSLPANVRTTCRAVAAADVVISSSSSSSGSNSNSKSKSPTTTTIRKAPLLLCCSEHMCNYREDLDVSAMLGAPKHNVTFHRGGGASSSNDKAIHSKNHNSSRDDDRDLWFKAAVIAVPIAGGFILILLVLLAVRMLKTDYRHHRRLIVQIRRKQSYSKAHMYITDHFVTEKQHCSLFDEKTPKLCPSHRSRDSSIYSSLFTDDSSKKSNSSSSKHKCDSSDKHSAFPAEGTKTCDVINSTPKDLPPVACSTNIGMFSNNSSSCDKFSDNNRSSTNNSDVNASNSSNNNSRFSKHLLFSSRDSVAVSSGSPDTFGDVSVRVDKAGHSFRPGDSSSGSLGLGDVQTTQTLAIWDKTCPSRPANVV